MLRLRRRKRDPATEDFDGGDDELRAEIERLTEQNRAAPDRDTERRLLRLRHIAGRRALDDPPADPRHPEAMMLPDSDGLLEFGPAELTPELLRAGILRDGCLLVRGFVGRDAALAFAAQIDRAFAERDDPDPVPGYYEEFAPHPRFGAIAERPWIKEGGGVLAADSPLLSFEMMELFRAAGVPRLVAGYLGEPPLWTVQKTTLRKAEPTVGGAWHQDGAFMGDVRSLNLWLALSRCGDESPGLDRKSTRLNSSHVVTSRMPSSA